MDLNSCNIPLIDDPNKIIEKARTTNLNSEEIYYVLTNIENFPELIQKCLVELPPCISALSNKLAGSLFIYNKSEVSNYMKDGHSWKLRKDNSRV